MNIVSFYSAVYTTSNAAVSYIVPKRCKLVAVRWNQYIATTGVQGLRWTLSTFPTDPSTLVGAEAAISTVQTLGSGTAAFNSNFLDRLDPGLILDPGMVLYFHALALVAAPGTAGTMNAALYLA